MKSFIESQFSYCTFALIWMVCSREKNRKINHVHERAILQYIPHACIYRMTILYDMRNLHFRIPNLTITDDDFNDNDLNLFSYGTNYFKSLNNKNNKWQRCIIVSDRKLLIYSVSQECPPSQSHREIGSGVPPFPVTLRGRGESVLHSQ